MYRQVKWGDCNDFAFFADFSEKTGYSEFNGFSGGSVAVQGQGTTLWVLWG